VGFLKAFRLCSVEPSGFPAAKTADFTSPTDRTISMVQRFTARGSLLLIASLTIAACTWVKTEPGAEAIPLVGMDAVTHCERLGQATTSVRDRVAGVQRRPGKVEDELADLARNSALDIGGDTLVADGPVRDGQQRFLIFRCR
jgi:hypothetical protein